jgi:hypothetical protein
MPVLVVLENDTVSFDSRCEIFSEASKGVREPPRKKELEDDEEGEIESDSERIHGGSDESDGIENR